MPPASSWFLPACTCVAQTIYSMCFALPATDVKKDVEFTTGFMADEEEEKELKRQDGLLMNSCPSFSLLPVE